MKSILSFTRTFALLGALLAMTAAAHAQNLSGPYHVAKNNLQYNLLFCDNIDLYKPADSANAKPWQKILFAASPDAAQVRALADNGIEASAVRLLADGWLRQHFQNVPQGQLLGVVIEVSREEGQDTLAAYGDGSVRYIDHADKLAVIDPGQPGASEAASKILALFGSSAKMLKRSGAWGKPRLPSPVPGKVRMSFLTADGLHFGEGSFAAISKDGDGSQVIGDATALLQIAVKYAAPVK